MEFMTVQQINEKLIILARNERKLTEEILNHIILFQNCNGYLKLGFSSMHEYLTRALGYSDDQSYRRLKAAKLMQAVPEVGDQLKSGNLNLSQAAEVQKAIETSQKETGEKVPEKKKKEIIKSVEKANNFNTKNILANELNLKPKEHEKTTPQSNRTVRLEVNLTPEQFEKLKTVKSLLSHKIPDQNTGKILECLCDQYLNKNSFTKSDTKLKYGREDNVSIKNGTRSFTDSTEKTEVQSDLNNSDLTLRFPLAANSSQKINPTIDPKENLMKHQNQTENKNYVQTPAQILNKSELKSQTHSHFKSETKYKPAIKNKISRYIPIAIKQNLFKRAQGCCEYVNHQGHRCTNRYQLEIDHALIPFSQGGEHTLENLILACSNHNSYRAIKMGIGFETSRQFAY